MKTGDKFKKGNINFIRGSVIDAKVDAIVNAANETLLGGGGVDGAIHRAAGKELLNECQTLNGCLTGEAKITGAYELKNAKHIIHTVGPIYSGSSRDAMLLANCYKNSLDLAVANGCTSIAFPCISTGVYGYPKKEAAEVSLTAVEEWLEINPNIVIDIYFYCYNPVEMNEYMELIKIT